MSTTHEEALETALREEWGRLGALLVARFRRLDLAEDGLADAFEAAARTGRTGRHVVVTLPGGSLDIDWQADDHVRMSGDAVEVFDGFIEV